MTAKQENLYISLDLDPETGELRNHAVDMTGAVTLHPNTHKPLRNHSWPSATFLVSSQANAHDIRRIALALLELASDLDPSCEIELPSSCKTPQ